MKIILKLNELQDILKKSFPKEMLPEGSEIKEVDIGGYSFEREMTITIGKKEE